VAQPQKGAQKNQRLPVLAGSNAVEGQAVLEMGLAFFRVAHKEEHDNPHGIGDGENILERRFVEGGNDAGSQSFVHGLKHHLGGGKADVNGIGKLPVGHAVFDVCRTAGDYDRGFSHVLLPETGLFEQLPLFRVLNDYEPPGLAVFCRGREPAGFQNPIQTIGIKAARFKMAYRYAVFNFRKQVHTL
jgi:hypothetical protein